MVKGKRKMFAENLAALRKLQKITQEELAEKAGITRQTLSKYETGESLPDISVCSRLAQALEVTIDDLVNFDQTLLPIPPKGKHLFGVVRVGENGQVVLPAKARKVFDINPGDNLIVLGDESQGIAIVKQQSFFEFASELGIKK